MIVVYSRPYVMLHLMDDKLTLPVRIPERAILCKTINKTIKMYEYMDNITNITPRCIGGEHDDGVFWCTWDEIHRTKKVYSIPISDGVEETVSACDVARDVITQYMVCRSIHTDIMFTSSLKHDFPQYLGYMFYCFDYHDAKQAQTELFKRCGAPILPGIIRIAMTSSKTSQTIEIDRLHNDDVKRNAYEIVVSDGVAVLRQNNQGNVSIILCLSNIKNVTILDGSLEYTNPTEYVSDNATLSSSSVKNFYPQLRSSEPERSEPLQRKPMTFAP